MFSSHFLYTVGTPRLTGALSMMSSWMSVKLWKTSNAAAGERRPELLEAMAMPIETDEEKAAKISKVIGIYDSLGIGEDAKNEIIKLHAQALAHVETLDLRTEAAGALENYAKNLIGRTK